MKRNLFVGALLLACGLLFSSCEDVIWDIAPVEIKISVCDANGNDLLDPTAEGTLACEGTRLLYDGVYYDLKDNMSPAMSTRYFMPEFYGIKLEKDSSGYMLCLGEFDGHKSTDWTEMVVEWSDGTTDTFAYSRRVKNQSSRNLKIKTRFYHNDKEVDSSKISIVK